MQRHSLYPGVADYMPAGGAPVSANEMEARGIADSCRDSPDHQEWRPHLHSHAAGRACQPKLPDRPFASPRRIRVLHVGDACPTASVLVASEDGSGAPPSVARWGFLSGPRETN